MTGAAAPRRLGICVIGNSHVGALRRGWEGLQAGQPDVQPVFFASPGRSLANLRHQDNRLVCTLPRVADYLTLTSGGRPDIGLADFDAFVLVGLAFLLPRLDRRHTEAVRRTTCQDAWSASLCATLVALIRQSSTAPVLVAHNPLPTDRAPIAHLDPLPYDTTLAALQDGCAPTGVHLLPQPTETRTDDWFTRREFRAGAANLLGQAVADSDTTHMNGHYGELWWRAALLRLQAQRSNT